jgi:uncharacterized repeat protein (TIGR01451 family)
LYWSENNNFGLVLYDLAVVKKVKTIRTINQFVDTQLSGSVMAISGTEVEYTLDIMNLGPSDATGITVSDYFSGSELTITNVEAASLVTK